VRALPLLLLLAAAAGCASPGAATLHEAASPSGPALVGASFHTGFGGSEATLGVEKDGTIFVTGFAPGDGVRVDPPPAILRSRDHGKTWQDVGPVLAAGLKDPPFTGDPYLVVDPQTGRVFSSDLTSYQCMSLAWSDDEGASWSVNPAACSATTGFNDHQSLVAAKPRLLPTVGYADVLHVCVNRVADAACTRSLDGGLTFGPTRPLAAQPSVTPGTDAAKAYCGQGSTGRLQASPDGTVWLPVVDTCTGLPLVAVSQDDGLTWTTRVISKDRLADTGNYGDHEAAIAIDSAGHAHAMWLSGGLPYVASSSDLGATWTEPRLVSPPEVTAADLPAIAAGGEDRFVVAYLGTTIPGGYHDRPFEKSASPYGDDHPKDPADWDGATWNAYLGVAGPDGRVLTTSANDPADPLARGACGHMRCATGGGALGMGDFIDVVVDLHGRPWASFIDACTQACAGDPRAADDRNEGLVATLAQGPSLLDGTPLGPLG